MKRKQAMGRMIASFIFCFYLIGIVAIFGVFLEGNFSPRIAYIPFLDNFRDPVVRFLNVLLFVTKGLFLPMLNGKYYRIRKILSSYFFIT